MLTKKNSEKNSNVTISNNKIVKNDTKSITEFDKSKPQNENVDKNFTTAKTTTTTFAANVDKDKESNHKSEFNFAAVGDWDCNSETKDTVENILEQDPEVVLALGDLSYNGKAKCWLNIIEPLTDKTKIVIGNMKLIHQKLRDYMSYFGIEKQYYSFNYKKSTS